MQLAGLTSDRGRTLMHVHDRAPGGAVVSVVVTDTDDAPALEAAAKRGIPTEVVPPDGDQEEAMLDALADYEFELVCLDEYEAKLPAGVQNEIPTAIAIHPSLLPAFPGSEAIKDTLDAGVRMSGTTIALVTSEENPGPIVAQEPVPVYEGDSPRDLTDRLRVEGAFKAAPRAIRWFAEDRITLDGQRVLVAGDEGGDFPARRVATDDHERDLRYGENPHQSAALYADATVSEANVVHATQCNEGAKTLSYNNYNDADGALNLVKEFDEPAVAVIKHTNPAGCAVAGTVAEAYDRALRTDPMSAFGGIVSMNRECDAATAEQIVESFKEVVVAPSYTDAALDVLRGKDNLRILDVGPIGPPTEAFVEKPILGGRLVQDRDLQHLTEDDLEVVTERAPDAEQIESLLFAWQTIKHVKSNAIVFATGTETVGIGMGQVSRVDAVRLAALKADEHAEGKSANGAVMSSDAFFPFPDGIEVAAEAGIEAVIQPGGSVNDDEVIAAAEDLGLSMVMTGKRCFRHD